MRQLTFFSVFALLVFCRCGSATEQEASVSELLWLANKDVVHTADEPLVIDDIAFDRDNERNADQCTSKGCMWPKSANGVVHVPYTISASFASRERAIIERGLTSFHSVSCIRFFARSYERDYISIQSNNGYIAYWYLKKNNNNTAKNKTLAQELTTISLYHSTVQHELLHALGFNHEQCRSDRDRHIRILWENIQSGWEYAFDKMNTLNMNTPYDYNSVMQYHRYAFSGNNKPTMVPIPNANVSFGNASEMSKNDIARLNSLYNC
ncbi:hatching enzyme 1.2-like [Vanacampus margaritifer]